MTYPSIGECCVEIRKEAEISRGYQCSVSLHWWNRVHEAVNAFGYSPDEALTSVQRKAEELLNRRIRRLEDQVRIEKDYRDATLARILAARQRLLEEKTNA